MYYHLVFILYLMKLKGILSLTHLIILFLCNHKKEHINKRIKHFFLKLIHILSLILLLDSELSVTVILLSLVLCNQERGR